MADQKPKTKTELFNSDIIQKIVQGFQAAIQAAPTVASIVVKAKDFFTNLFNNGLITKDQQNALHSHVDEVCAAALAGKLGPEFDVEPDDGEEASS